MIWGEPNAVLSNTTGTNNVLGDMLDSPVSPEDLLTTT